jgi:hypothetical protein
MTFQQESLKVAKWHHKDWVAQKLGHFVKKNHGACSRVAMMKLQDDYNLRYEISSG